MAGKGRLTARQVAWARGHDWFLADYGDGTILVVDRWVFMGRAYEEPREFTSWRELRTWAGY